MSSGSIIGLAIGAWASLLVVVASIARAARRSDDVADRLVAERLGTARRRTAAERAQRAIEGRERRLLAGHLVLLALAAAGAVVASREADWRPIELVALLAVLAVGSDYLALEAKRFRISGSFLALVLAMALLGPAPAALIGVLCAAADGVRSRHSRADLASNLSTYAAFPLLGALALHALAAPGAETDPDGSYAILVFGIFVAANALNFALIAGHTALLNHTSLARMFQTVYVPVLPWELASGLVTAAAVYGYQRYGPGMIGVFALALGVYQLLLKALLEGQQNGEQLTRRVEEIGVRHERMLGLMLHTLSLRDPTAARHAAATAHYTRELARAAGLSRRDQEVAHTAALLHDIGREAFPDAILIAEADLDIDDRRLVRRHPTDGARLLRDVPGLERVAEAVLSHHERPDGTGYPSGLTGDAIPRTARVVAIAEVYDVLTAPDSYRRPLTVGEAIEELRRVAGSQLDAELVETFAAAVTGWSAMGFRRRGDADLEAELRLVRSARELFEPDPRPR